VTPSPKAICSPSQKAFANGHSPSTQIRTVPSEVRRLPEERVDVVDVGDARLGAPLLAGDVEGGAAADRFRAVADHLVVRVADVAVGFADFGPRREDVRGARLDDLGPLVVQLLAVHGDLVGRHRDAVALRAAEGGVVPVRPGRVGLQRGRGQAGALRDVRDGGVRGTRGIGRECAGRLLRGAAVGGFA
jgi:hypothetical protein